MTRELPGELFLGRNDGMQISTEFSVILPTNAMDTCWALWPSSMA